MESIREARFARELEPMHHISGEWLQELYVRGHEKWDLYGWNVKIKFLWFFTIFTFQPYRSLFPCPLTYNYTTGAEHISTILWILGILSIYLELGDDVDGVMNYWVVGVVCGRG